MESEDLDNYFVKKKRKKDKGSLRKKLGVFSARNSNFTLNRKFNSKMDKIRVFFSPISGHFFRFSKKSREAIPPKAVT